MLIHQIMMDGGGKHITGNSGSITISTNEFIIANADRNNTHFLVDYSSNVSRGFIWVVEINGNSYYSDDTAGIQQYGSMSSNQFVDTWQENIGVDIESVLWNGGLSLPPGDITSFGIKINNQDNADSYAIDNFRVYYGIDPISYYFNPVANVSGTTGGVFTASSNDISIDTSTGEIDLDNSSAGSYSITYTTQGICPKTATTSITINNSFFDQEILTECNSFTWPINGVTYYSSGTYYDSSLTVSNCDSVYQLDLTINNSLSLRPWS